MEPFGNLTGVVLPLKKVNVDTDQIIPAQFLKRIERTGFGQFLFFDLRFLPDGSPNPDFILNHPGYQGSSILVAGRNFGSGSSREHAPWALLDYGFRCIIAPSYADIFYNNCFQNGILPVVLAEETVDAVMVAALAKPGYQLMVDLESQTVSDSAGDVQASFEIEPFRRHCMLNGLDDIGLTLEHMDEIVAFEASRGPHGGVLTIGR